MKKYASTLSLLFLSVTSYAQQFNLTQLMEITSSSRLFEMNMLRALNQMHEKQRVIIYSYHTSTGGMGATSRLPTNNKKYEPRYLFDNGVVYTESEIEDQKLDESFEIRNKLRGEGKLLNKAFVDSFSFQNGEITSLIESETIRIGFAESYNSQKETARTWYSWESKEFKILLPNSKLFSPSYNKISVQYVSDVEFSNILKQIISSANYIETNEEYGSFISSYKIKGFLITTEKLDINNGGIVTVYVEK